MRFGLVGTGPWATMVHGPGLLEAGHADLVGVWGRSRDKAETLAASLGVAAYDDYDALLGDVEAIAFAVPPDVQADLAVRAARAGKHLLLEKPIAMDVEPARAVRDAAAEAGVASLVFFTDRFIEGSRAWFQQVHSSDGWRGGWVRWFASLQQDGNPFGGSAWREERGALWDVGPHVLSTMSAALGPIVELTAIGGDADLVTLVLRHGSGATTTASLTVFAPPAAEGLEAAVWGSPECWRCRPGRRRAAPQPWRPPPTSSSPRPPPATRTSSTSSSAPTWSSFWPRRRRSWTPPERASRSSLRGGQV